MTIGCSAFIFYARWFRSREIYNRKETDRKISDLFAQIIYQSHHSRDDM
jgi:hypothetical protein